MITLLSGGTGTPKLLSGMAQKSETIVIGNTGDDVEIGDLLVCPDLDTVMYLSAGILDQKKWWGIKEDTFDRDLYAISVGTNLELYKEASNIIKELNLKIVKTQYIFLRHYNPYLYPMFLDALKK